MLRSLYQVVGWLILPAVLVIAVLLAAPFAAAFSAWALVSPESAFLWLVLLVAVIYIGKGVRAASTLWGLMTRRKRIDTVALQAVEKELA